MVTKEGALSPIWSALPVCIASINLPSRHSVRYSIGAAFREEGRDVNVRAPGNGRAGGGGAAEADGQPVPQDPFHRAITEAESACSNLPAEPI
ncbi:hypothetical protein CCHR01_18170 [Colletotrichum chrysophilum]|uniref:Uncharacterized protein n=1 Tax=Colletotrichum chrysophilum TaxID=1836956 RepID=A0AAD9E8E6_9PEZI|nr:hypothetical protein CCHR01_18170 [Colletotrichum chrysophilum]